MTIAYDVVEQWDGRTGGYDADRGRVYARQFRVRTSGGAVGPIGAEFAPGIPRVGASYVSFDAAEYDPLARCVEVKPRQGPDPFTWYVECEYRTPKAGQPQQADMSKPGGSGGTGDATDEYVARPPYWRWGHEVIQVAARRAWKNPDVGSTDHTRTVDVVNAAGRPFDPLPTAPVPFRTLDYVDYVGNPGPSTPSPKPYDSGDAGSGTQSAKWLYACNKDVFLTYAAGSVQCVQFDVEPEWVGSTMVGRKRTMRFRFVIAGNEMYGFSPIQLLNAGYDQWLPDTSLAPLGTPGKFGRIKDAQGRDVSAPWPLTANGLAVDPSLIGTTPTPINYLSFHLAERRDFSPLNVLAVP